MYAAVSCVHASEKRRVVGHVAQHSCAECAHDNQYFTIMSAARHGTEIHQPARAFIRMDCSGGG